MFKGMAIPSSFAEVQMLLMDNIKLIAAFAIGVFAAPTVSDIIDRIRG